MTDINMSELDAILGSRFVYTAAADSKACGPFDMNHRRYIILTSGGIVEEGYEVKTYPTPEEALHAYCVRLQEFVKDSNLILFRRAPTLEGSSGAWTIYSRLSVV